MKKSAIFTYLILPFGFAYFVSTAFRTVNATLAPTLIRELHFNASQMGMLTSMYMLFFAIFQIPVGILLDHIGPRKTIMALYSVATVGIIIFALGSSVATLAIGRALLGIGIASGFMSALKMISTHCHEKDYPLMNSLISVWGGLASICVTTPAEWVIQQSNWRVVCFILAGLTVLSIVIIGTVYPRSEKIKTNHNRISLKEIKTQYKGLIPILTSMEFWQIAPIALMGIGSYIGLQGLWTGPWLHHAIGLNINSTANYLSVIAIGMTVGFLSCSIWAKVGAYFKKDLNAVIKLATLLYIISQVLITLFVGAKSYILWFFFSYIAQIIGLCYAAVMQRFPKTHAGRATTALNTLAFFGAFISQYGFGAILDIWHRNAHGAYPHIAYQIAWGTFVALQVLALVWFCVCKTSKTNRGSSQTI